MARGYMGKILNVDLSAGTLQDEVLDKGLCRDFLGGYGLGAKLLYDRMPAGVDPLGPDNLLGFFTGRPEFLDIGITYALLNVIGTLAVLKFFRYGALGRVPDTERDPN